ncbi:MAG TPA: Uma2 family endonuclease [Gemmata sp.]
MTAKPPPLSTRRPFRFTREQYHEMGVRGFFDGKRVELIFGEIIELSPTNWPHVVACRKIAELLERIFAGAAWVGRADPINLAHSDPQPDVAVFPGRFEDYVAHPTTALLVVEVSDTTLAFDLTTKVELYATASIADYWVLDIPNRQLHVFRDPQPLPAGLGATAYQTHLALAPTDTVNPLAAPNASVCVSDLLP